MSPCVGPQSSVRFPVGDVAKSPSVLFLIDSSVYDALIDARFQSQRGPLAPPNGGGGGDPALRDAVKLCCLIAASETTSMMFPAPASGRMPPTGAFRLRPRARSVPRMCE